MHVTVNTTNQSISVVHNTANHIYQPGKRFNFVMIFLMQIGKIKKPIKNLRLKKMTYQIVSILADCRMLFSSNITWLKIVSDVFIHHPRWLPWPDFNTGPYGKYMLKIFSSETIGPLGTKLGHNSPGVVSFKNCIWHVLAVSTCIDLMW